MDKKGRTPLSYADLDERIFALLIKAGANVDHRDNDGKTPLHRCIMGVSAGLLLDAGADINARDNRGLTPLGECSGYRHAFFDPEKMKLLEERGARL
jgi:ankyrin repeat protein